MQFPAFWAFKGKDSFFNQLNPEHVLATMAYASMAKKRKGHLPYIGFPGMGGIPFTPLSLVPPLLPFPNDDRDGLLELPKLLPHFAPKHFEVLNLTP
jgi:hypothetical protein